MNYLRIELLDKLASEYVIGTLHGGARRRFQRLLREHPSARVAVESWQERMAPMSTRLDAAPPSAALWTAIQRRIAPPPVAQAPRRFAWAQLLGGLALGAVAMSVVLPLVGPNTVDVPPGRVMPESYAGILRDDSGAVALLVSSLRHGSVVDIKLLRPVTLAQGQSLQLWALTKDAPPQALGRIPPGAKPQLTLAAPSETLLAKATELAVSIEPDGRAAPAQPSGPFVFRGPCAKFW